MRPSTNDRYLERIERVVDALLSAPADAHSVESLAAVANMSAYHFHRVFRTVMGETVNATMRRVRLSLDDAARPLLERYVDDALPRVDDGPITDLLLPVRPRTIR